MVKKRKTKHHFIGLFTDTWFASSTSLYLSFPEVSTHNLTADQIDARILGNPVDAELRFQVSLSDRSNRINRYRMTDGHGRLIRIIKKARGYHDERLVNVAGLADGQYTLIVDTEKGSYPMRFTKN